MANLINIPSIQNIVDEGRTKHFDQQIKELFRTQIYETFPINDFVKHQNYAKDQRFHKLVDQLEYWNNRVEAKNIPKDAKAEFYRNSFLFTSLKSILVNDSKGSPHYELKITSLFEWLRNTSKNQTPKFLYIKKRTYQDDDWKVRKTFKSNLPQQLTNYERRVMFTSQQQFKKFYTNRKQFYSQKQIANEAIRMREYSGKHLTVREMKEDEEVERAKSLLKLKQARFNEDHSQNEEYFQGQFNVLSKTTELFLKKRKTIFNFTRNTSSFSSLDKQATQIQNIKRYRLAKFLPKKDQLPIERNQEKNKTVASFTTSLKPFDLTSPDIDETGKIKQGTVGRQMSIDYEGEHKNSAEGLVGSYSIEEFVDFHDLKNWEGTRLMSNPFQHHKKPLKKKKKKAVS